MKLLTPIIIIAATTPLLAANEIRLEDCPKAVRHTIKSNLNGDRLDDIERKRIDGKVRYVVDIDGPGDADRNLRISPAGDLLFVSEDIKLSECPAAVRSTIKGLLKVNWRIDDIDRETTASGTVRFRVDFDRTGKRDIEFKLSRKGKVLGSRVESNED